MATINLGAIKFNWKGAYNNSTAYAVDDVVSSGGSSYVCILASTGNAVSNGTYWNIMSSAGTNGTNGTDVGTVITTQGDILYRDGSGLQRLAKGTAGQVLKINSGATAPEWGTDVGGKILQVKQTIITDTQLISSNAPSFADILNLAVSVTPASTSNKVLVTAHVNISSTSGYRTFARLTRNNTPIAIGATNVSSRLPVTMSSTGAGNQGAIVSMMFLDTPNNASPTNYNVEVSIEGSSGSIRINGELSDSDNGSQSRSVSTITAMEITG
jgi:hypothetical protein